MRAFLTLSLTLSLVGMAFGEEPLTDEPVCRQHPATGKTNRSARAAGNGIRAQHLAELEQARKEGKPLGNIVEVGGGDCPPEDTPRGAAAAAVGALLYDGQLHCSAVLVAPTMVVTAAHCVNGFDLNKMVFALGADTDRPIQRASAYRAEPRTNYDPDHLGVNDVGYVHLARAMTEAAPVKLTTDEHLQVGNRPILYVGYGIAGSLPGARRCVTIPVHDTCGDTFSAATKLMNTCNGDSGGGVFFDSGTELSLVGVTNWGDERCADFAVSADVGFHRDWIKAQIGDAPHGVAPAHVEESGRKRIAVSADALLTDLRRTPEEAPRRFESTYQGKWVNWKAKITTVKPAGFDDYPGACTVVGKEGRATMVLQHFPGGCDLQAGRSLRFTGRLARLQVGNLIEIALPEAGGFACPETDTEGLDKDLRAGLELYRDNRLEQAIIRLEAAVSKADLRSSEKVCGYLRIAQSHERLAREHGRETVEAIRKALSIDPDLAPPDGLEGPFARAQAELKISKGYPRRLQVAAAVAVALKRIRARDGSHQPLWAPMAFLGIQPLPNRVPHLSIGLAAGGGVAQNTAAGFVVGAVARLEAWHRVGLIGGLGFRFSSNDRLRHAWGVGVTVRLWSFTPSWQ